MSTTVETEAGKVEGVTRRRLTAFKGIPHAAAPVGDLRLRPPIAAAPWVGVRPAGEFGPSAPQPASIGGLEQGVAGPQSEDCLSLNVWTPGLDTARRPVMVWIHGGAFVTGSGGSPLYRGSGLADAGEVVVVTINYRLGAAGFLAHPDLDDDDTGACGNWGLLDQVAALRWVRDNIAGFGGDPANVTVFGESAGAFSVAALFAMPAAKGLFHRAVAQSGGTIPGPIDLAAEVAEQLAAELGMSSIAALREVPAERLVAAMSSVQAAAGTIFPPLWPITDGGALPKPSLDAVAAGLNADVPLLIGTNRDEMRAFGLTTVMPALAGGDDSALMALLKASLDDAAEEAVAVYRDAMAARGQDVSPYALWSAIESDHVFRAPALQMAEAHTGAGGAAYVYLFTWESPGMGGLLGSCHGLDIPFVFGTHTLAGADMFTGAGPEVDRLSAAMQGAWLDLARTGAPGGGIAGEWPRYDAERRATKCLGRTFEVVDAPGDPERAFWTGRLQDTRSPKL